MPLFDFECQACHHRWEEMFRGGELPACPACAATDVAKLLTIGLMKKPEYVPTPGTSIELKVSPRDSKGNSKVLGHTIKKA
ncbi:MAG: zinc ribbon domain-containing protein [Kofleriaceae bacterium]|nr:zinc ribbon domain-containing protein [Kofleriaceae bacterium]MCL4225229.1 zinc ribbon domain-containing protein [Myxococcales bacterium]